MIAIGVGISPVLWQGIDNFVVTPPLDVLIGATGEHVLSGNGTYYITIEYPNLLISHDNYAILGADGAHVNIDYIDS